MLFSTISIPAGLNKVDRLPLFNSPLIFLTANLKPGLPTLAYSSDRDSNSLVIDILKLFLLHSVEKISPGIKRLSIPSVFSLSSGQALQISIISDE